MTFYADHTIAAINESSMQYMQDQNKGVFPVFFLEDVEDVKASEEAGTLRMRQEERVKILTSGDPNSHPVHPVTDDIKRRFAEAYRQWKATNSNEYIEGFPLTEWPLATRAFVQELRALNIRSVEDLSVASDITIMKIVDGRVWRDKALAWLDANKDAGKAAKYAAVASQLKDDNARLQSEIEGLKAQFRAFMAKDAAALQEPTHVEGGDDEEPRRRGRPRNS